MTDYGFSYIDDDPGNAFVSYGCEYKNSDSVLALGTMTIKVTSVDESGKVIDVYEDYKMVCLLPEVTEVCAGRTYNITKKPSDVSIELAFDPLTDPNQNAIGIEAHNLRVEKEDDEYHIFGEIENRTGMEMNVAIVDVIFKDDKGKIVSGDCIYVDPFSGEKTAFEQDLWEKEDAVTNNIVCTAYGVKY